MKKYFLMLVMLFAMSVYSFAEDSNATKIEKAERYEMKINHRKLAEALGLSKDQMEMSEDVMSEFENDMMFAAYMASDESSDKIVANSVRKNIQNMHYILTDKQYHRYLLLLNLTLNNRGFNTINFDE